MGMAPLLAAINKLGMAARMEPWGWKITKRSRHQMAFSGEPNTPNTSLLSCFIRGLNTLGMKGNNMIGTIVQFIKQDGSSQQTMSIDQPPCVVIDAIRHGTPKFVRDQLTSGTVETIDILRTELNDEKHPQGKGERVETILVNTLEWLK